MGVRMLCAITIIDEHFNEDPVFCNEEEMKAEDSGLLVGGSAAAAPTATAEAAKKPYVKTTCDLKSKRKTSLHTHSFVTGAAGQQQCSECQFTMHFEIL